jgi:hypothetical protein
LPEHGQVPGDPTGVIAGGVKIGHDEDNVGVPGTVEEVFVGNVLVALFVIGEYAVAFEYQLVGAELTGLFVVNKFAFYFAEHAHHRGVADVHDFKHHGKVLVIDLEVGRLGVNQWGASQKSRH